MATKAATCWHLSLGFEVISKKWMFFHLLDCQSFARVCLKKVEDKVLAVTGVVFIKSDIPAIHGVYQLLDIIIKGVGYMAHQKLIGKDSQCPHVNRGIQGAIVSFLVQSFRGHVLWGPTVRVVNNADGANQLEVADLDAA